MEGAVLTRRRAAAVMEAVVVEMVLAQEAWTSAWMLVLPQTGSSSCAWPAAARGALLLEVLLLRGEEKAVEQVGGEAEEGEVGMGGSRREGRGEEGVVVVGRGEVGLVGAREEAGSKVDWWPRQVMW